jgi:hypothetical protein
MHVFLAAYFNTVPGSLATQLIKIILVIVVLILINNHENCRKP